MQRSVIDLLLMRGVIKRAADNDVFGLYFCLVTANIACWIFALFAFRHYPLLLGTAFLAYSFGLRHAIDADHIAAIDNVTRKFMQENKRPLTVGLYFALGHSTIVIALSATLAVTAIAFKGKFPALESFGDIGGTLISAAFLGALGLSNSAVLKSLYETFQRVKKDGVYDDENLNIILARRGLFGRLFSGLFSMMRHSWQMYPIGLLFGLGFDTATEVGLLGISSAEASKGLNTWSIMIFPALFTVGMILVDTTDSVLMVRAYSWAFLKPMRKLYYNLTITALSAFIAFFIGGIEILGLVQDQFKLTGPVWNTVKIINNHFGILGYLIISIFVISWIVSVSIYKLSGFDHLDITLK